MFIVANSGKQMSRTVSARIKPEMHEKLRERCNKIGCNINDFIESCIELGLTGHSDFDFGDKESSEVNRKLTVPEKSDEHGGKTPVIHLQWEDGKLIQGETTWEDRK